jgi:glycosyltransferase involved in cell wall biosynthesis
MQVQLSVVIITFNEEKNIGRCLDSVFGVADEIVVVDSFSTDKTKQVCKEKKVCFVEHNFDGHIEQKNWAITQAKHQYILSLDADEALTPELQEEIIKIKNNWRADGYIFNRLTNYCGQWIKHCGWYPDKKLRLWDSTKGVWGGENPHDKVIMKKGTRIQHIKQDILHYSYYTLEEHTKQLEYFAEISAKAAFKKGKRSNPLKIIYKSWFKFFRNYILKLGFLDGHFGYVICKNTAKETAIKYRRILELGQK